MIKNKILEFLKKRNSVYVLETLLTNAGWQATQLFIYDSPGVVLQRIETILLIHCV